MRFNRTRHALAFFASVLLTNGCASSTYRFGSVAQPFAASQPNGFEVTVGGAHPQLDKLEQAVHYPAKKFKQWFGRHRDRADINEPTDEELREVALLKSEEYLSLNQMYDVKIDLCEYSPREQWKRLRANDSIAPFWKYSTGILQHVEYCLLPGRVFRRDRYNLFTNTLSLNSAEPEQALYTAATAKYLRARKYPGAFSTACYMPLVPLYRDCYVANDVLSYARFREDWETEKKLYPEIYGSLGGDLVSQATSLVPAFAYVPFYVKPALKMGGRLSGNATGNWVLKQRQKEIAASASLNPLNHSMPVTE